MNDLSMKLVLTIAAATIAVSSFPLIAQPADTAMSQATAASAGGMQGGEFGKVDANAAAQLQPASGEPEGKLDAKTAKMGERVVVQTKTPIKTADGTEIPKGAKLVGKVSQGPLEANPADPKRVKPSARSTGFCSRSDM